MEFLLFVRYSNISLNSITQNLACVGKSYLFPLGFGLNLRNTISEVLRYFMYFHSDKKNDIH